MNALALLIVHPDIGGILHIVFTPGNPLHATMVPAPMLANTDGKLVRIDLDKARFNHPGCHVVSFNPKDGSSTITPLAAGSAWYEPTLFQQRMIKAAIVRALAPKPPQEGITP